MRFIHHMENGNHGLGAPKPENKYANLPGSDLFVKFGGAPANAEEEFMEKAVTFTSEAAALAIKPPSIKKFVEHFHASDRYFGIRIMRPSARSGKVTKNMDLQGL